MATTDQRCRSLVDSAVALVSPISGPQFRSLDRVHDMPNGSFPGDHQRFKPRSPPTTLKRHDGALRSAPLVLGSFANSSKYDSRQGKPHGLPPMPQLAAQPPPSPLG